MSLRDISCPGCTYSGVSHLESCPNRRGAVPAGPNIDECAPVLHVPEGTASPIQPEKVEIVQTIIPSSGTKLVCTDCGRADWHTLILRRRAGLLEGLCKQVDGSGCYPLSSRRNCSYVYPEGFDCPRVAEYVVALGEEEHRVRQVCRDHVGEVLRQGPLYQVWPLED